MICLNNNLGGFTPIIDDTGKITGYKTSVGGADTVFPFNKVSTLTKYSYTDQTCGFTSEQSNLTGNPAGSGLYVFLTDIPNYQNLSIDDMIIVAYPLLESASITTYGYVYFADTGRLIIYPKTGSRFTRSKKCLVDVYV